VLIDFGRPAACNEEKVLAFHVRQHQRTSESIEYVGRRRPAALLLKPWYQVALTLARCDFFAA